MQTAGELDLTCRGALVVCQTLLQTHIDLGLEKNKKAVSHLSDIQSVSFVQYVSWRRSQSKAGD